MNSNHKREFNSSARPHVVMITNHGVHVWVPRSLGAIAQRRIITEVSRTDRTKRKNILVEAFARVHGEFPDAFLAVTIAPATGGSDKLEIEEPHNE